MSSWSTRDGAAASACLSSWMRLGCSGMALTNAVWRIEAGRV